MTLLPISLLSASRFRHLGHQSFYPQRIQHAEMIKGEPEVQARTLVEKLKEAKMI